VPGPIEEQAREIPAYLGKIGSVEALQSAALNNVKQPFLLRRASISHEVTSEFGVSPRENVAERHAILRGVKLRSGTR